MPLASAFLLILFSNPFKQMDQFLSIKSANPYICFAQAGERYYIHVKPTKPKRNH